MKEILKKYLQNHFQLNNIFKDKKKIKFLCVGIINTLFGTCFTILTYELFYQYIGFYSFLFVIVTVNNLFSFILYKIYVFKSRNNILLELLRFAASQGFLIFLVSIELYFFLEFFFLNIYITKLIMLIINTTVAYFIHNYFSFKV